MLLIKASGLGAAHLQFVKQQLLQVLSLIFPHMGVAAQTQHQKGSESSPLPEAS